MMYEGRIGLAAMLVLTFTVILYSLYDAIKGKAPEIRKLAPIDGINEGVDRAAEMGRPIHVSIGVKEMSASRPGMITALAMLRYICERAVRSGARVITSVCFPDTMPLIYEIYQDASKIEGQDGFLREEDIVYLSSEQFAYATGVAGILTRERCATNFILGEQAGSCMILAEVGSIVGAFQVSGVPSTEKTSVLLIASDYTFIGEEFYAGATSLSGEKEALGTIRGQDIMKLLIVAMIIISTLLVTAGNTSMLKLLTM